MPCSNIPLCAHVRHGNRCNSSNSTIQWRSYVQHTSSVDIPAFAFVRPTVPPQPSHSVWPQSNLRLKRQLNCTSSPTSSSVAMLSSHFAQLRDYECAGRPSRVPPPTNKRTVYNPRVLCGQSTTLLTHIGPAVRKWKYPAMPHGSLSLSLSF